MRDGKRGRRLSAALVAAALAGAGAAAVAPTASATAGCKVDYVITSSWPGGFNGNVTITNLGDALSSWQLTWTFSAGQTVVQAWTASVSQSGSAVTAGNAPYNGSIPTGGTASFGFNGSWNGSNPAPGSFALNGSTCTGSAGGGTTTTTTQGGGGSTSTTTTSATTTSTSRATTTTTTTSQSASLPCDIYASGGTPCVAAHSTTRALYRNYSGNLYQVRRASDSSTRAIGVLSAGGGANSAAQDSFCSGTSCVITVIYDQSGRGNNLTQAPPGGFNGPASGGYDNLANATAAPTSVYGQKAYGVYVSPGMGYRNNNTSGVATGDSPEGMYAIFDGTHYNGGCCFDYGNAETNSRDNGNGTMEAIYFGNAPYWGTGSGSGPWVMADLENGLFSGVNTGNNSNDPSVNHRYLTAIIKGESNHWAIRAGNAQSGGLSTFYDGKRPNASGYNPMKKEGAIILGIGGDNSVSAAGTFYEGVMTSGYPSTATENAVQANIVTAGYGSAGSGGGTGLPAPGSTLSLRATTACCTTRYLTHSGGSVVTSVITSSSSSTEKANASWVLRAGLANSACVSFESRNTSGSYLRHYSYQVSLQANDGSSQFASDATFCPQPGVSGQGTSFFAVDFSDRYLRHYSNNIYIASNGGSNTFDSSSSWSDDVTWVVSSPWAQ